MPRELGPCYDVEVNGRPIDRADFFHGYDGCTSVLPGCLGPMGI
jgi:hypothetical protein